MVVVVVALIAVIAALLAERAWHARVEAATTRRFVSALVAKDAAELGYLDRVGDEPRKARGPDEPRRPPPEGL